MICEICGLRKANKKVFLEGTTIYICDLCSKSIKSENILEKRISKNKKIVAELEEYIIDENFHKKIKDYREKNKLKQKDMAKLLGIKESLYKSLEEGKIKPSLDLAKKIEKIIGEKIVLKEKIESDKKEEFKLKVSDIIKFEE